MQQTNSLDERPKMYDPLETRISEKYLREIFRQLKDRNTCLIGGWATYHIVNQKFHARTGRDYIGSRDIDIGFYIDRNWTGDELKRSDFSQATTALQSMGFYWLSFRLAKDFESETGKELTPEEAKKHPLYEIFQLYIDLVVNYIHPKLEGVVGFVPIDEPLLSSAFIDGYSKAYTLYGIRVLLPESFVLLAMKMNSVVNRTKDEKRIKDIADIYALIWFADIDRPSFYKICSRVKAIKTIDDFKEEEIKQVSNAIGIEAAEIQKVLKEMI
jgi:hypothetical protein